MATAVCYGIGAGAFLALIILMLVNRKPRGFGLRILLVCILTAAWSAAAAAGQVWWMRGVAQSLESLRSGGWLFLLAGVLADARKDGPHSRLWNWLPLGVAAIAIFGIANDVRLLSATSHHAPFADSQILWRVVVAICGLLIVENIIRNTPAHRRWHVFPLCIAVGALFAYDLFVFAEAVVLRRIDASLLAGRGLVLVLMVPLLALTMVRNPDWRIDIHVSRRVVFHTATLMAAGIFLVVAAGVATLIGRFPGEWAAISKITFFCGSIVVLVTVLSTESLRSRLKRAISENFFSTRYDYRTEWMRSITTLSASDACEPLNIRAIRALADVVDSPGGVLWMQGADGLYRVEQSLNMTLEWTAGELASGPFVAGFRGGEALQEFSEGAARPAWAGRTVWLAVPLLRVDRLIGFVVLSLPRVPTPLNWESFDLLLTIGQQVAGYLVEERATRALLESQALINYSRKFSFVIHDIKNVSGQLSMMIANIPRFGERAEFRADLVRGMESAAKKLGDLIDKLRPDACEAEAPRLLDPARTINEVVSQLDRGNVFLRTQIASDEARVRIAPSDLKMILTHLTNNAIEASPHGDAVTLGVRKESGLVVIDITDKGCGMSADFVRDDLFAPLHSTKALGHGIGAYQARDLVRAAGGDIEVVSAVGCGTTMRILLPDASEPVTGFSREPAPS